MKEERYEKAIRSFDSISGWRDADEKRAECRRIIDDAKAKAEAERIEKERQEEAERLEKERQAEITRLEKEERAEKRKKKLIIGTTTTCVLVVVILALTMFILPNLNYSKAMDAMEQKDYVAAFDYFKKTKGVKDSITQAQKAYYNIIETGSLCAGDDECLGLQKDGTVVDTSGNKYQSSNENPYISIGRTFALKSDGTVEPLKLPWSEEDYNHLKRYVNKWEDVIAISDNNGFVLGVKSDGTVVAAGYLADEDFSDWTDIVAISASTYHAVGLKSDGTVVSTSQAEAGPTAVSNWENIIAISTNDEHTVGLMLDGTVVATEFVESEQLNIEYNGQCDVEGWTDIIAIKAGRYNTLGLRKSGTAISTKIIYSSDEHDEVSGWKNIRVYKD